MPNILKSTYPKPPFYQYNGHAQTLIPGIFRKIKGIQYERERLELADGDFLDLDWIANSNDSLIVLSHGLEGSSERAYIKGMAKLFSAKSWDVLAWNCRSCSGEMNRKLRLYNHGEIGDIEEVIQYALKKNAYRQIALIGFSMGGSINLKFTSLRCAKAEYPIVATVSFSTPVDLKATALTLDDPSNAFYRNYFKQQLKEKMKIKSEKYPDVIDFSNFKRVKIWSDFDNWFSAPLGGYEDAEDFYRQASAVNFIEQLTVPSLLVNAKNDPILPEACFPTELAENHPYFYLEAPELGGHVGFSLAGDTHAWSEYRAWEFVDKFSKKETASS